MTSSFPRSGRSFRGKAEKGSQLGRGEKNSAGVSRFMNCKLNKKLRMLGKADSAPSPTFC